ncbi:UDP-N-acetylmuramoyl-L-alanyl-D-glutamate--2,6-diaminopimelate ligase [Vibrio sp.]|nr:UDP-N-acetylmuramoyl-L-alanyl-D-glutamate--2,6-diaminopimelate ligase [Vibrio sp.]
MISLSNLLDLWFPLPSDIANVPVTNLELDSRRLQPGDVFCAIKGHQVDGRRFIDAAIQKQAAAVLVEADQKSEHGKVVIESATAIIYFYDLPSYLSEIATRLYPTRSIKLIGITGTNGKTTVTQLIAQWLTLLGKKAAVMGTTGNGFLDDLQVAGNTTGNPIEIAKTLYELEQQGAEYCALEVSSHGLVQHRIKALHFDVSAFSNLSRDHLDYHDTMENYAEAKKSLFTEHKTQHSIINYDDETGQQWIKEGKLSNPSSISLQGDNTDVDLYAHKIQYLNHGMAIEFSGRFGSGVLNAPLIGEFNASNLLLAFHCLLTLGFDQKILVNYAQKLSSVIGRMEIFHKIDTVKIVVDYAHTPDALQKVLQALRHHCQGSVWAIVGCGGDRDKGKRPEMSRIAEQFSDYIILTDDNPRTESSQAIIQDMLLGLSHPDSVYIEHDRYQALWHAAQHAKSNDIILLAGKGHEDYQIIGDQVIHYSDRESAQSVLEQLSQVSLD